MPAVALTVVIPTLGRKRLNACLESLSACTPRAEEVLVVDQSGGGDVSRLVGDLEGARTLQCPQRGVGVARNMGLRQARHGSVLMTDDDCTVHPDWVGMGWELAASGDEALITGRVLPAGDPRAVPSTIDDPLRRDYTGELRCGVLYTGNMLCSRARVLAVGGFDERIPIAEDNDFCYRWLRAGYPLRYEPRLVVWHHDWRTQEELRALYVAYARAQGHFYAKHLRRGDPRMLRFVAADLHGAVRALAAAALRGRPAWTDSRRGVLGGLPVGLLEGWRAFARPSETDAHAQSRDNRQ